MIYLRLALASAIFIAGCTVTSWYYGKQIATMQKEAAEATTKAVQEANAKSQAEQAKKDEAINEANKRAEKNQALARALDGDVDSLRNELASTRANLPAASCEAIRNYATTLSTVFESCSGRYQDVAGSATGHASDVILLEAAWPD